MNGIVSVRSVDAQTLVVVVEIVDVVEIELEDVDVLEGVVELVSPSQPRMARDAA